jgi:predicted protein tyrosine phosphatase
MKIFVHSEKSIATIKPKKTYAIISIVGSDVNSPISETLASLVRTDPLHYGTLHQEFDDIEAQYGHLTLFTKGQGNDILDFVRELQNAETEELYIHCHAGISRSAAVASAIELWLGNEETSRNYWMSASYAPNAFVYQTLLELMGKYDEEEIIKLRIASVRASEEWVRSHVDMEYF